MAAEGLSSLYLPVCWKKGVSLIVETPQKMCMNKVIMQRDEGKVDCPMHTYTKGCGEGGCS